MFKKISAAVVLLFSFCYVSFSQNAIVTENALPGSPSSQWDITGAGDLSIQGFATDMSVNTGSPISFKISAPVGVGYTINIYRLGYYQGNGARLIATLAGPFTGIAQPTCVTNATTGIMDCGNWTTSATWSTTGATSGVYIARLRRNDNGGASHIVFVVRDDAANSPMLFKTSDATWQGYNVYGGNSLYVGSVAGYPGGHATKVSYNRPFITRNGGGGGGVAQDWIFNAEYPMIRWLERNGYNLSYTTDVDMERSVQTFTPSIHKVLMSVGHDEYWSATERSRFETARTNGVHLAFFSGNEVYWKTRWENSVDGTNTPNRTLVCYKEGTLGENVCNSKCDPLNNLWTGLWRDGCSFPTADGCKPENALTGQISWAESEIPITVPSTYKSLRFWRNTSVATLPNGQSATLTDGTLGYEWDPENDIYLSSYPNGRIGLSSTTSLGKSHALSFYKHSSGALVFGAGSVQWSWGLDATHDRGNAPASQDVQQATMNLFADMGVQPATKQANLVAATASTDVTAPTATFTNPLNGASLPAYSTVNIQGTATDVGGVVGGVEISVDGGATWTPATGTTTWSYSWTPTVTGSTTLKVRGIDDSGNMPAPGTETSITIIVTPAPPPVCPCNIFGNNTPSPAINDNDGTAITLGTRFRSNIDGYVTGVRYYKSTVNIGTHKGMLYSNSGTLLAQIDFTNETASGWQVANFNNPVAISAGVTYVIAYFSASGDYTNTVNYFNVEQFLNPLRGLADGFDGANGVYSYAGVPTFPNTTYSKSNYWVDPIFNTTVAPDITPPTVTENSPLSGATSVALGTNILITLSESIDQSLINGSSIIISNGATAISSTYVYDDILHVITVTPDISLMNYSTTYTVTVKGGNGYNVIKDLAGNNMVSDYVFSFTTVAAPPPDPSDGPGGPILVLTSPINKFSRFPSEILRAEGWDEFKTLDISTVTPSMLNTYEVVILGDIPVTSTQVTNLTNWVNGGGTLIAFSPDPQLATLLGVTPTGGTLSNQYLLFNSVKKQSAGLVNQTIQFHGNADFYTVNAGTDILATLYSSPTAATSYPAVTLRNVGANGGQAIAFTYDLARSIVYTRQGNPAWNSQNRDGQAGPIRSDNLFFGNSASDPQPDWVNLNKVDIPQADEQMRLLSNLILDGNMDKKPLPRFWFLPKGKKAALVMTGDDHAFVTRTKINFDYYISQSPSNTAQAVRDWDAIRGTSYMYSGTGLTPAEITNYQNQGFEFGLHLNTNCLDFTPSTWNSFWNTQYPALQSSLGGAMNPQVSHRIHCLGWSEWSSQAKLELAKGIRVDVNYYYWPDSWIQNRPGMFTGSGYPMRFADLDGTLIDVYQVPTQMTDESGQTYPFTFDALVDKALGPQGFYGVFCANLHNDDGTNVAIIQSVIASAKAKGIPVISAKQMLTWLDARNNSSFSSFGWTNNTLTFTIAADANAFNMRGMLPSSIPSGTNILKLQTLKLNGIQVSTDTSTQIIKGYDYFFFPASSGNYQAVYGLDLTPPLITNIVATPDLFGNAVITWSTDEISDSRIDFGTVASSLTLNASNASLTVNHTISLSGLTPGLRYYFRVTSKDQSNNSATESNPPAVPLEFVVPLGVCASTDTQNDFQQGNPDANTLVGFAGEVILNPFVNQEFSSAPSGWTAAAWPGGALPTILGGIEVADGGHITTNSAYPQGTSIEFSAIFTQGNFQNIGFVAGITGLGDDYTDPFISIGRGNQGDNNVYLQSSLFSTPIPLGSNLLNSFHRYKITWTSAGFAVYIDGNNIPSATVINVVAGPLKVDVSDFPLGGGAQVSIDWIRISPYPSPGVYTSKVFDANTQINWNQISWTEIKPINTSINVSVKTGNTPVPDGSWTTTSVTNGGTINKNSRYLQYVATLSTADNASTPVLQSLTVNCATAFPVNLLEFRGHYANKEVVLDWTTATESNNKEFKVQRSQNGLEWIDIGFVPGAGNSATNRQYTFTDNNLSGGKYYYRLMQVDIDGRFSFSNIIVIIVQDRVGFSLDQNHPNPSSGTTMISYSIPRATKVTITIFDLQGRILKVAEEGIRSAGRHSFQLNTSAMGTGLYYYRMQAEDFMDTKKMIIN